MRRDVHLCALVRVKVPRIDAASDAEAIDRALQAADLRKLFREDQPRQSVESTEWAVEIVEASVEGEDDRNSHTYVCDGPAWVLASTCSECGKRVERIIGCPDGAEICQECFDAVLH